ncbi:hypothetical protein OAN96_01675, partial [Candidatus Gracilibacteria bacterium]|nr:hypothetical protein [Candidatus Gracilibacteria bacterium]
MFKKLVSLILCTALFLSSSMSVGASSYKNKIDLAMERLSLSQMQRLDSRIDRLLTTDSNMASQKVAMLKYMQLQINKQISAGSLVSQAELVQVSEEIMKIQANIAAGVDGQLDALVGELISLYNVEEKGSLSLGVDIDYQDFGNLDLDVKLDNYTATTLGFDSQLQTNLSAFMSADISGQKIDFDMSAFLDYITKDGNVYLLMQDLKINSEITDEIREIVETLQKIAEVEGYISIE